MKKKVEDLTLKEFVEMGARLGCKVEIKLKPIKKKK